jgi:branched-chain amino acid transport system permease protein
MDMLVQTLANGIMGSLILILVATGLCLIFGIMHIVNFAHGEFYMLGGFGVWLFFDQEIIPLIGPPTIRYLTATVLTFLLVALLGILVERYIFRRFRGNLQAILIVSFAVMLILQAGALVTFGVTDKAFGSPFSGHVSLGSISISGERFAAIICGMFFILAMYFWIYRTRLGKAMRAVSQDSEAALVQGINIKVVFSLAMGIGCALAAVAGALVGPIFYVNPYMGVEPIMKAFVVVILGGMGSLIGAIIGGFVIGITESFIATYVGAHAAVLAVFLLLIAVLLIKPTGMFGHAE